MTWFVLSLLDQTNETPLYVASEKGHHDVVQSLLGAGAEVNIARSDVSDLDKYGLAYHCGLEHGCMQKWCNRARNVN